METKLVHILTFICLSGQCLVTVAGAPQRHHHSQHQHRPNHHHSGQSSSPSAQAIRANFVKDSLVRDAVPTPPAHYVKVVYENETRKVELGNELTPTQAKDEPIVSWLTGAPKCDQDKLYSLFLIDVDATSRSFAHWVVMNIPGDDVQGGDIVVGYIGPAPPAGTGLHRYTFLVYEQPGKVTPPNPWAYWGGGFDVTTFAKQYNLVGPYAGNYFKAQAEP